jgi:hypothetical protein
MDRIWVISTQFSAGEDFSCALYTAVVGNDDCVTFHVISSQFSAQTCMSVQESAYNYALRLYPGAATVLKNPPYLIWHGPRSSEVW